jgi:hypothetical protein
MTLIEALTVRGILGAIFWGISSIPAWFDEMAQLRQH